MSAFITQFITHLTTVFISANSQNLVASVPLSPDHPFYSPLHQALQSIPDNQLSQNVIVAQIVGLPDNVKDNFGGFVSALLRHVKGHEDVGSEEEERSYGKFQRLQQVYFEVNRLYAMSTPDGPHQFPFLNPLIVVLARLLLKLGKQAASLATARQRESRSSRSILDTLRQTIEKSVHVATSSTTQGEWDTIVNNECIVGDNIWLIANILSRMYAERRLHQQSLDLARSIENMQPREEKRLNARGAIILATDVCQSYYWRGRVFLILLEFRTAKRWLDKAWAVCPPSSFQQRRAILIRLIPVNMLVGLLPSMATLQQYNLPEFAPLIQAYRTGNVPAWRKELDRGREWFRRRHIWLILYERGETLVWRNLFRQSLKLYYQFNPDAPKGRCPTRIFVAAVTKTFEGTGEVEDGTTTLEDIISTISSLIDHGLILGILSYSHQQLAMKGSADGFGGFPRVSQVVPRAVIANT